MSKNKNKTRTPGWVKRLGARKWVNWTGPGDTQEMVEETISQYGEPIEAMYEDTGYMACLIYRDKVVATGYDGSEYTHTFKFGRASAATTEGSRVYPPEAAPGCVGIPEGALREVEYSSVWIEAETPYQTEDISGMVKYCLGEIDRLRNVVAELEEATVEVSHGAESL